MDYAFPYIRSADARFQHREHTLALLAALEGAEIELPLEVDVLLKKVKVCGLSIARDGSNS